VASAHGRPSEKNESIDVKSCISQDNHSSISYQYKENSYYVHSINRRTSTPQKNTANSTMMSRRGSSAKKREVFESSAQSLKSNKEKKLAISKAQASKVL
jgi:hypothetical protein